jgi:UDP-N-acetylmuramoylalanine--D-glutamate ligase
MDTRPAPLLASELKRDFQDVRLVLGGFDTNALIESSLIIISPGISLATPEVREAKRAGAHIVGDIELFLEANSQPVIAITGSNGKSTVTSLVGEMCEAGGLKALVAGNIGLPVLDAITDNVDYQVAVLELSSFQLETTNTVSADAAAILNVSADHLDRYDSMGDYLLAKARIFRGTRQAVLPRHDAQLEQVTNASTKLSFALDEPANDSEFGVQRVSGTRWLHKGKQRLMKLRDVPLMGLHNIKNVLAAFALVDFLSLPVTSLVSAVESFHGLPHRMQTIANVNHITWVNDSKATNIGAASTALLNIESDIIWIAGGQGKGADFSELKEAITSQIKLLLVLGEDGAELHDALYGSLPIERVETMREAVFMASDYALNNSSRDTVVLLSPACASFDMYQNYEARGDDFSSLVSDWQMRGAV